MARTGWGTTAALGLTACITLVACGSNERGHVWNGCHVGRFVNDAGVGGRIHFADEHRRRWNSDVGGDGHCPRRRVLA